MKQETDQSKISTEEGKNPMKRSPTSNFERRNQDEECQNNCESENLDERYCPCKNEKAVDFEKQLKILNKVGEEVETTKENPGILNGIKNFFKHPLKHNEENCSLLTTTLNPDKSQNQNSEKDTIIIETSTVNIGEISSEANNEVNTEANNEANNSANNEFIEANNEANTGSHIETTEKEKVYSDSRHIIELDNKDSNTTPFSYNNLWNELGNDDDDFRDHLPKDEKCKEPLDSFTFEIKANPSAKRKSFKIKIKY